VKELKILAITAVISASLATLLCIGLVTNLQAVNGLVPHQESTSTYVSSYSYGQISTSLDPNERWVVDFSSGVYINAYLYSQSEYYYYLNYGTGGGYRDYVSGYSGTLDYTSTASDTYYVVFINNDYYGTTISLTLTEYLYP
jgi:hypothetical protein